MPWYGWFILLAAALFAAAAITFRILRATHRGRRFLALSNRNRLRFGRILIADGAIGWPARIVLGALVAYLAMPFDIIPDFVPVLGQADDLAVVILAVALLIVLVPRDRFERALARVELEAASAAGPPPDRELT